MVKENYLCFSTSLNNKSAVKRLLGKRNYTCTEKNNMFTVANFFYRRVSLLLASIVCVISFVVLDQFAFRVRLDGLSGTEYAQVQQYLREQGIKNFTPKHVARNENLALELVRNFDFVAHANVHVRASTITISIHRADNVTSLIPCEDIVATHDGVIADIIVFSGTANVTVGDVVQKGDVLVTGTRPTAIITITNGTEIITILNNSMLQ